MKTTVTTRDRTGFRGHPHRTAEWRSLREAMNISEHINQMFEDYIVEAFPDRKHRAFARWYLTVRNKCATHRFITGRDPTDAEIKAFIEGGA